MATQYLDLGAFGRVASGENVGRKGVPDGPLAGGWMVAGGILYSPNEIEKLIAAEYGWASAFLDHKELGPLIRKAAKQGWTEQKLMTELEKTRWWKNHTQSQRNWQQLKAKDPAEAGKQIDDRVEQMKQIASQIGGTLPDDVIRKLAERSIAGGWTDLEVANHITKQLMKNGETSGVMSGVLAREMRQFASDFAVPMSDATIQSWVESIASGKATIEDYNNYIRKQAKGLYATLADDIDRGLTVKEILDPYAQVAARVLGVTAEQMDFTSGIWNKALDYVDASGTRRTMTLGEWETELRMNPEYGYSKTPEATDKAYALADSIARTFGKVG